MRSHVAAVLVTCAAWGAAPCAARPVFTLHPGFAPAFDLPLAAVSPGALAFLPTNYATFLSARWTIGDVTSLTPLDRNVPLDIRSDRASSLTPVGAGGAVALGSRAGVSVVYRRTDDTFDASRTTLVALAHVDSADGTQSARGSSTCDTYRASCGVRVAEWAAIGLSIGAQQSRAHVRVARRETLEDPPGAPPTALARYTEVHDVRLTSRTTPLVGWGVALRPHRVVEVDVASRPSVTLQYASVVSQVSGLSEVFYPESDIFSANRFNRIVSPDDARGRSDADITMHATVRLHERFTLTGRVAHVTTYPIAVEPRGRASATDRLLVDAPHRADLWHASAAVRATRHVTVTALWDHTLRAAWDVDGRSVNAVRLPAWGVAVDLASGPLRVRAAIARVEGDVHAVLPLPPASSAATQHVSDTRVTTVIEWR